MAVTKFDVFLGILLGLTAFMGCATGEGSGSKAKDQGPMSFDPKEAYEALILLKLSVLANNEYKTNFTYYGQGKAQAIFWVFSDGSVKEEKIEYPLSNPRLKELVQKVLILANPLPKIPDEFSDRKLKIVAPFHFRPFLIIRPSGRKF